MYLCLKFLILSSRSLEIDPADIKAVGITNQRETTIVWDKNTGKPLYNAIGMLWFFFTFYLVIILVLKLGYLIKMFFELFINTLKHF